MSHVSRLLVVVMALVFAAAPPAAAAPRAGELVTVAGIDEPGYSGDGGDARAARLGGEMDVTVAADGAVYIADQFNDRVRVVTPDGVIDIVPGVADSEEWAAMVPVAVATDDAGALYVATNGQVRRSNPDGTFTVIAGASRSPDTKSDEDAPAIRANLFGQTDMAVAADGTVYLADRYGNRIRRVSLDGTISTIAGGGIGGVTLDTPRHVAVDRGGNVYLVHDGFRGVQKVAPGGAVSTVLGQHTRPGFAGDGGLAADAAFRRVAGIATDPDGNLYVADFENQNVRVIDTQGVIDTIGPSVPGLSDVTVGPDGDLYLTAGAQIKRLRRGEVEATGGREPRPRSARWLDQEPGTVLPVAGTGREMTADQRSGGGSGGMAVGADGTVFYTNQSSQVIAVRPDGKRAVHAGAGRGGGTGTGMPAAKARLDMPGALAVDGAGNVYIADRYDDRILKVDTKGIITTVAGTGGETPRDGGPNGDGGKAVDAAVQPENLATGPDGSLYVVDRLAGGRIRKIDPQGVITSIVGGGERGIDDTTSPTEADLNTALPSSLAVDAAGDVYFAYVGRVYVVSGGVLSPVTADGRGFAGDGGPAAQGQLNWPSGLAIGPDGTRYVADTNNNRVRAIRPDGVITTVAGTGARADSGDGGPATEAGLREPDRVATDAAGNLYVTTAGTARIRRIDTKGVITTVVRLDFAADGRRAEETVVDSPVALAVDPAGTLYVEGDTPLLAVAADGTVRELADLELASRLAAGRDGSVYVVNNDRVDRIHPDGATVTVAGGAASTTGLDGPLPNPDGKRATGAVFSPDDVAVAPSGELYIAADRRVYRLTGDGTLKSVVDIEKGAEPGGLAIAVGQDGSLYVADGSTDRVYAVNRSGELRTFAGTGTRTGGDDQGDGGEATDASLASPSDVAVAADGTVYVATYNGIRRVSPDGDIDTVVDGGHGDAIALALDPHGNLYFAVQNRDQVFVVVRPGELPQPFPWTVLWLGLAVVAVVAAAIVVALRRRGGLTKD